MAYSYEYISKVKQLGVVNYTLKLTDDLGVYPDCFIPLILSESECSDENLDRIANEMIQRSTPLPPPVVEEIAVPLDVTTDSLSTVDNATNITESV